MKRLRIALFACAISCACAETPTDDAIRLYAEGKFPEAKAALDHIVAVDPRNAVACYYLGMTFRYGSGSQALTEAASWFAKAVALAPNNSAYLGEYGGVCLLIAEHDHSFFQAIRGRDAMKKVLELNPDSLKARDALMRFYAQAPWPLGSNSRALAQAEEIGRRDPAQGLSACLRLAMIFENKDDRSAARAAWNAALGLDPANSAARAAIARLKTL